MTLTERSTGGTTTTVRLRRIDVADDRPEARAERDALTRRGAVPDARVRAGARQILDDVERRGIEAVRDEWQGRLQAGLADATADADRRVIAETDRIRREVEDATTRLREEMNHTLAAERDRASGIDRERARVEALLFEERERTTTEARAVVGMQHVLLNIRERGVRFAREGVELNFAAFAKGFALDRMSELLRSRGAARALLSAGHSSVLAVGDPRLLQPALSLLA